MVPIDHPSRVSEARRAATALAEAEGVADPGRAAIVASELATNILKYATKGALQISPLSNRGGAGVEILAMDRGPGIVNLTESLRDGHSTAGTSGTGLGAVKRLSDEFDVYSQPGKTTVLMSRIRGNAASSVESQFVVGVTERPVTGEEVSGDGWGIRSENDRILMMVADGLGHGLLAADASRAAVNAFRTSKEWEPIGLVEAMHRALRSTRGAAVAVAVLEFGKKQVRFSGLGNIAGTVMMPGKSQGMVSLSGIAGHEARQIREFVYPLSDESLVVMHSDGLSANWATKSSDLLRRHPGTIS